MVITFVVREEKTDYDDRINSKVEGVEFRTRVSGGVTKSDYVLVAGRVDSRLNKRLLKASQGGRVIVLGDMSGEEITSYLEGQGERVGYLVHSSGYAVKEMIEILELLKGGAKGVVWGKEEKRGIKDILFGKVRGFVGDKDSKVDVKVGYLEGMVKREEVVKRVEEEIEEVEEDEGFDRSTSSYDERSGVTVEMLEELGGLEENYGVEERVVVREVINDGALQGLYGGVLHKMLLVTGDRGSGVTSTAYNIANYVSSKGVSVLLVDCDDRNYGLLSYINYYEFCKYDDTTKQGVKLCQSVGNFGSSIARWGNNLDLLSSNYGVRVSEEELENMQGVLVEKLRDYSLIVVDCPIEKLPQMRDAIMSGTICFCVEESKRGLINLLLELDRMELENRYKLSMLNKGIYLKTKQTKVVTFDKVKKYVSSILGFSIDWFSLPDVEVPRKMDDKFIERLMRV